VEIQVRPDQRTDVPACGGRPPCIQSTVDPAPAYVKRTAADCGAGRRSRRDRLEGAMRPSSKRVVHTRRPYTSSIRDFDTL
jgi:hypothetical protein